MDLAQLETPCLLLDRARLERNAERMGGLARANGLDLRPHLKTAKCAEVAALAAGAGGALTVSTLREAEWFAARGFRDLTWAVCLAPDKLPRALRLMDTGVRLGLLTDDVRVARELARRTAGRERAVPVWIEIDCGEHRTGLAPDDPALLAVARELAAGSGVGLAGVLTHGGHSYACSTADDVRRVAEEERAAAVAAAECLRAAGHEVPRVSAGSTPTASLGASWEGVDELRPGVYLFGDVFQAQLGSCALEDLALSVLTTVVSARDGRVVVDAGGLALSKDRSRVVGRADPGYGLVADLAGELLAGDAVVRDVHQEHGEIRFEDAGAQPALRPGERLRVLPVHACMTAAAYGAYHVVEAGVVEAGAVEAAEVVACWERVNGW